MDAKPAFQRLSSGALKMGHSEEARKMTRTEGPYTCKTADAVRKQAIDEIQQHGGDWQDELVVLGQHRIQFGMFIGQTFRWMLENGLGYSGWLVDGLWNESLTDTPLSDNKFKFKKYLESFDEGRHAVELKKRERTGTSDRQSLIRIMQLDSQASTSTQSIPMSPQVLSNPPSTSGSAISIKIEGKEMPAVVEEYKSSVSQDIVLPDGWKQTLPKADHLWVSKALFQTSNNGQVEPDWSRIDQLWWYPPHPSVKRSQLPRPDEYYAQRLLLWMPRQLLQVRLLCPQPTCQCELTSLGIYPYVRQVLDVDGFYNLAAEHLECESCTNKVISWSDAVIKQLDAGHRLQFPVFLTTRNACDIRVVRHLRQCGPGNSVSKVQRKIQEQHDDTWQQRTVQYLADCQGFVDSHVNGLTTKPTFEDPPIMTPIPTHHWFELIYCNDVIQRLDEVKASVTSVFGRVLKLHSTKKIVRKLSGYVAGTAVSATSVGNEHGQVLISVLAAVEGCGLHPMVDGIVQRYSCANEPPPDLLYVDRNCCGMQNRLQTMFSGWPYLKIRLDISHFMRQFAAACTSDSHQLYDTFMQRLSSCIFEWSSEDLDRLKAATWAQMVLEKGFNPSDQDVMQRITKKELSIHCRRKTRGVEDTTRLIFQLLKAFDGEQGFDIMGVPLLNKHRIWNIWETQKKHIECIQDPPDFQLYLNSGELHKAGVMLPVYRCARGCTSVESFHNCLQQFIPATTVSDLQFQTYLLNSLVRWNQDRVVSTASNQFFEPSTSSGIAGYAMNELSRIVLGKELNTSYRRPQNYTGELIGVEYLYNQTGAVLQYYTIDPDTADAIKLEPIDGDEEEEDLQEDDIVEDATVCLEELLFHEASNAVSSTCLQPVEPIDTTEDDNAVQAAKDVRERINLPVVPVALETSTPMETSAPMEISTHIETSASTETSTPMETSACMETVPDMTNETPCPPDESAKPDSIPGYEQVVALAEFLVQFSTAPHPLTNEQAARLIQLWKKLNEYDRNSTSFAPHYGTELNQSTFKEVSDTAADVEINERCSLGQHTGILQWPDCNRYVECLIAKLCEWYPSTKQPHGIAQPKWTLVCKAYKNIQAKVLGNAAVMKETSIQLSEINETTVSQWYNKIPRSLEPEIFEEEVTWPIPVPSASMQTLHNGRVNHHQFQQRQSLNQLSPIYSYQQTQPAMQTPKMFHFYHNNNNNNQV
ncbi:uncharacterized protein [Ptychodera flava]|uniref:uncharacterized protein isoform X2 n=1 Tax=Ptychodera flava TaxID=63121 RepID=UPI00396A1A07